MRIIKNKKIGGFTNKKKLIAGIFFIVLGVVLVGLGFLPQNADRQSTAASWQRLSSGEGEEVQGTVVASRTDTITEGTRRSREVKTVYCPVYEYPAAGTTYRVNGLGDDCKESESDVAIGTTTPILYDPSQPAVAFVNTEATEKFYTDTNGTQWVAWILGALLVVAGIFAVISARPKTPEQIAAAEERRRRDKAEFDRLMAEIEQPKQK